MRNKGKVRIAAILYIVLCIVLLVSASSNANQASVGITEASPAMKAFMEVLKNNTGFYMCETSYVGDQAVRSYQGKHTLLRELLSDDSDSDYAGRTVEQFAVVDMDGSGVPEVVIELSRDGERIVFHNRNDRIYGFGFSYRGMNELKIDGTFSGSSGAASSSIGKLEFLTVECKERVLAYSDDDKYYVNDKQVSEDMFNSSLSKHWEKEDADWYSYSAETFEEDFISAWNK